MYINNLDILLYLVTPEMHSAFLEFSNVYAFYPS